MQDTKVLHELCEHISGELKRCNNRITDASGEMSTSDVDYLNKLAHTLKCIETVVAMKEADDGYSGRSYDSGRSYRGRSYEGGNSYEGGGNSYEGGGNSYARGRRGNVRRDSMGRYSRESGYSYHDGMEDIMQDLKGMMGSMPEEKRREVERFINKMDM